MKNKNGKSRKGLKITLLLWSLIILSGAYIGMSFFPETVSAEVPGDSVIEALPPLDDDDDNLQDDDYSDDGNEDFIPTDPIDLVNYALNIYNNGKGSQSTISYSAMNKGVFGGIEVSLNQYAVANAIRCGNQNLEECYFYFNDSEVDSMIKSVNNQYKFVSNYYRAINVDHDTNQVVCVTTTNYNRAEQTYDLTSGERSKKVCTVGDITNEWSVLFSEEFPLEISYNTVKVTSYNTKKDKNYNYVTVSYKIDKLPEPIISYYRKNSMLTDVNYQEYNYTFVINKKTGKLRRIIREESFTSLGVRGTVEITSKVRYQQDFQKMDSPVTVRKPYLEYAE